MIIECIKCGKKFEVDSDLIPEKGRNIQCGSCHHIWFYQKNIKEKSISKTIKVDVRNNDFENEIIINKNTNTKNNNKKNLPAIKKSKKISSKNIFFGIFSFLVVSIISLIAIIIVLDTFKNNLISVFPNLEIILYNLFETIMDIKLFLNDLVR